MSEELVRILNSFAAYIGLIPSILAFFKIKKMCNYLAPQSY